VFHEQIHEIGQERIARYRNWSALTERCPQAAFGLLGITRSRTFWQDSMYAPALLHDTNVSSTVLVGPDRHRRFSLSQRLHSARSYRFPREPTGV
jgi:hypothetical protein